MRRIAALVAVLALAAVPAVAAVTITSVTSDGKKITITLDVPGGDTGEISLFRMETDAGYWTRIKGGYVRDDTGEWVVTKPRPTPDPEVFLRDDFHVELGREYCYENSAGRRIDPGAKTCAIHQPAGSNLDFPSAPADLTFTGRGIHLLRLEFRDTSDNETEFLIERRFPKSAWQAVAILPAEEGTGRSVEYRDSDLDMHTRYCYRVLAASADGSRPSFVKCTYTYPEIVPSVSPPEGGQGFLSNLSHRQPTEGELAASFVFSDVDFNRSFTLALFRLDNLDGPPERSVIQRIRGDWPHTASGTFFRDLDPRETYCAKISSEHINPDRFNARILCESPFGERLSVEDLGPGAADLPRITEVIPIPVLGGLRLRLENPRPGQLVDQFDASTGLRRTRLEGLDGGNLVDLGGLNGGATFCFRMFVTNEFGSRYGPLLCTRTSSTTSLGGVGGVGGTSGSGGGTSDLRSGVNCNCQETGEFVDPVEPVPNASDGAYNASHTASSLSVFRASDGQRVFHETGLNDFAFGFGPRSRYFLLAEEQDVNRVSVGVFDLEGSGGDDRPFFEPNVIGEAGWGFSPDGRTFILAREATTGQLVINLVNLDLRQKETLFFQRPFSGFWQFSPCGDAFVTGIGPSPVATPFLNLYATVDFEELRHRMTLPDDFAGVSTNDTNHVALRASNAPQVISPNTAAQVCHIPPSGDGKYDLQVLRFPQASITNSEADMIFADASTVLQTNDGPGDVACDVTFNRSGSVVASPVGDGSIDSEAELHAAFDEPGQAKVVNELNFCGALEPSLLGCAETPGLSFVFVRGPEEHQIVAHEFGHNKGLEHREDDPDALMFPSASPTALRVNEEECSAFRSDGSAALATFPAAPARDLGFAIGRLLEAAPQPPMLTIEEFVRRRYYEGIPYAAVRRYDDSVIPTLLAMLDDRREMAHWRNTVVVLGMIGDARVFPPLVEFIERDVDDLSLEEYRAKAAAIMSLGYVLNATEDRRLLDYLESSASPDAWEAREVQGIAPYQPDTTERNLAFSKYALLGLALAGTPESAQALRDLQTPGVSAMDREFRSRSAYLIEEALEEHRKIAARGLKRYYERGGSID